MNVARAELNAVERRLSLAAVMVHMTGVGLTLGVLFPLTSLTLAGWGAASGLVGLAGAVSPIAILLLMPALPRLARRLGAIRAMSAGCTLASVALVAMYLVPTTSAWIVGRFVIGAGLALPWLVGDVWINTVATETSRGRVVGVYVACFFSGFSLGPVLLDAVGIDGFAPHALGTGALALATVPLLAASRLAPSIEVAGNATVLASMRAVPVVAVGALVAGFSEGASFALLPVWGIEIGLAETATLRLLSVFLVGGIVWQLAAGVVADRFGRQRLLGGVGAALAAVAIALHLASGAALLALAFVAGGLVLAIYGLSLTLLGQRFDANELATASAAYLVLYQLGSVSGPLVAGVAMDAVGPVGLLVTLAASGVACAAIAARR